MCKAGTSLVGVSEAAASPCSLVLPLIRGDGRALHDPLPHHLAVESVGPMGVVRPGWVTGWVAGTFLQGVIIVWYRSCLQGCSADLLDCKSTCGEFTLRKILHILHRWCLHSTLSCIQLVAR